NAGKLPPAHPAPHPRHQVYFPGVCARIDRDTVSDGTEQPPSVQVKVSPIPGRHPHRAQSTYPRMACYVRAPLSPAKHVKLPATPASWTFDFICMQRRIQEKEPVKPYRSLSFSATALPAVLLRRRCHVSEH